MSDEPPSIWQRHPLARLLTLLLTLTLSYPLLVLDIVTAGGACE